MVGNWAGLKVANRPDTNIMVDLRVRLSRPCGNAQQDYNRRTYPINRLYMDPIDTCKYWAKDGVSQEHPLYIETGFSDEEYDVYNQNYLIGRIIDKIPRWIYSESDLKRNNYKMYFKGYSTLTTECSASYSTDDLAQSGLKLGKVSDNYNGILICSIVLYVALFIFIFFNCSLNKWVITITTLLDIGGYFALIALYSKL